MIVDGAAQARSDDLEELVKKKRAASDAARERLLQVCAQMDEDASGELTLDEIAKGYKENEEFASTLHMMDVGIDDLDMVLKLRNNDG